jgi:ABC-type nitrate/sulfonate/bicarbonate transport system permease component
MRNKSGIFRYPSFYILLSIFILWIILFGFLLPQNDILPGPGIVLISIPALFEDYHFLTNFIITISAIYFPGILAFLFVYSIREYIFKNSGFLKYLIEFVSQLVGFIPSILAALLVAYWFRNSFLIEYCFSFLISVLWWMIVLYSAGKKRNENYFAAFKSLGANRSFLSKYILWHEIKPVIFKKLFRFHLNLWLLILIFEFFENLYGFGTILKRTIEYNDLSALVLMGIIIPFIIFLGYSLIKYLENKYIFWEAE